MTNVSVLFLFIGLVVPFAYATPAAPVQKSQSYVLDFSQKGSVEFLAIGRPSALKIHGTGSSPKGQLNVSGNKVSGSMTADLNSLDTGIKLRNEHMKEKYLETPKYPEAKITLKDLELPVEVTTQKFKISDVPFNGTLSLHGVEKPIKGTAAIERDENSVKFDGKFKIKISDYNISIPSFAGITMAEDVDVSVNGESQLGKGGSLK